MQTLLGWVRWVMSLHTPMARGEYARLGVGLVLLKYLVELAFFSLVSDRFYTPVDFVSPFLSTREPFVAANPAWITAAWMVWTLPFLWIGVTATMRRAMDAGVSAWLGVLWLVPVLNWGMMVLFLLLPSKGFGIADPEEAESEVSRAFRVDAKTLMENPRSLGAKSDGMVAMLMGLVIGVAYLLVSVAISVYGLGSYGAAMFFGAPLVTCAASSFYFNRRGNRGMGKTILHAMATLVVGSLAFLLLGMEGAICIVMAIPLFLPIGLLGAVVGYTIATSGREAEWSRQTGLYGCWILVPMLGWVEAKISPVPLLEVSSSVEIAAPMEVVWEQVIAFPEIREAPQGLLATGIAYPMRARIQGVGVGAVRYCEFSTGSFVEPITEWEAPRRLGFDVTSQPEPMSELSPYGSIHPPHLHGTFRSVRGEFRLIEVGEGRTRLEGSTFYALEMGPRDYWRIWTDTIIHAIHMRVLEHIRRGAEERVGPLGGKLGGEASQSSRSLQGT